MIRIAVCDDEPSLLRDMRHLLDTYLCDKKLNVQITTVRNGEELLMDIEQYGMFQIIFLDIELTRMNGIAAAEAIRKEFPSAILIFISAYSEYYREAFDVQPFQFLDKPISARKLYPVLEKALARVRDEAEALFIYHNRSFYAIPIRDIIYLESTRRIIRITLVSGEFEFYEQMERIEEQLLNRQQQFIRIHKSYLINTYHIRELHYTNVMMSNGVELSISRDRRANARAYYMKWLGGEYF